MTMFLIILSLIPCTTAVVCNKEMQQGPFKLHHYENMKIPIHRLEIDVTRYESENKYYTMVVGYRSFWKSYCYQGSAIDSNTGCYNSLNQFPPTEEELKQWYSRVECVTGSDISDAWGSDSEICNKPQSLDKWHKRKELRKESTNNHFAHHTCTISWRCGQQSSKIPLELKWDGNTVRGFFILPNGTKVEKSTESYFWTEGEYSYRVFGLPKIKSKTLKIGCFYENNTIEPLYWCLDTETNFMFRLTGEGVICESQICYEYSTNKSSIDAKHPHSYFDALHEGNWATHAASLRDLQLVINAQHFEVENLRFNLAELDSRFSTLTGLFNSLITSVSKIDDRLIGNLLNTPVASKYLSPDQFLLYPCTEPEELLSNCHGNTIFQDGRWVHNEDSSKCVELGKFKEINLYQFNPLWMPSILKVKVEGLVQDLEGWSFIASSKRDLENTMLYTRNGGSGTSLQDILDYPAGWLNSKLHGILFGGGFLIVVVILIVLVLLKVLRTIF